MAENGSRPTPCPRCQAPITGDFKYCPTCAFRLRDPEENGEPAPTKQGIPWGPTIVAAVLGGIVLAIGVLGLKIWRPDPPPTPSPDPQQADQDHRLNETLTVDDHLQDLFVLLPAGEACWWPSTSGDDPFKKVMVHACAFMKTEVTVGMYAEFLRAVGEDFDGALPEDMKRVLRQLWRPTDKARYDYANRYIDAWWEGVEEHLSTENGALGPTVPERPADLRAPLPESYGSLLLAPPTWVYLTIHEELSWRVPDERDDVTYPLNLPVTGISWFDANAFAAWVSNRLKIECRLPADMEWLRAGTGGATLDKATDYPWGDIPWWRGCNNLNFWSGHGEPRVLPVTYTYPDARTKTAEGLYGMSGNAREWTIWNDPKEHDDRFGIDFTEESQSRLDAPTYGGSYREGIGNCTLHDSSEVLDKVARDPRVGFRLWKSFEGAEGAEGAGGS